MATPIKQKARIDRLDMRILAAVAARGRQTITELSKSIGLSLSPCAARLARLEDEQLITGYHAHVDVERLEELSLYYVTVSITPYNPETARELEALILASPYVVAADAVFGHHDYILSIYARSKQHFHEILAPFLQLRADCETSPVSRRIVRPQPGRLLAELKRGFG
jgi:Lrp/AsnC family transcriptional regulator, leucine-responsive regulatory protein